MNRKRLFVPLLAIVLAAPASATAQVSISPRAFGMGGAFVGAARGQEAVFLNPANLALPGNPFWSVGFPLISLAQASPGLSLRDLFDIVVEGDGLAPDRRSQILDAIPGSGSGIELDLRLPSAALQIGPVAVGVSHGVTYNQSFSRELAELMLEGYQAGRVDYRVGNTAGDHARYWDFAAAYGRRVGPASVGVTAHYVRGSGLSRARLFEPRFDVAGETIEIDYVEVRSPHGSGYGLDVGAAMQALPGLSVSGSVSNLFARMNWSDDLQVRSLTLSNADFDSFSIESIRERFSRSEQPFESGSVPLTAYEVAAPLFQGAYFPATLRVGAAWALPTRTLIAAQYQHNLTAGRLGGSWWDRSAGLGIEQKLPVISLRGGVSTNLDGGSLVTGGISFFGLDLAVGRLEVGHTPGARHPGLVGMFGLRAATRLTRP